MEDFAKEGKVVGVLLDVSLRHDNKGLRILDGVKKVLLEIITKSFDDDFDVLYLYHPDLIDPVSKRGEQYCHISNYNTDGWKFNLIFALKQTLYTIGAASDIDFRRYVLFITDRVTDSSALEQVLFLNTKDMIDAHFILVGIGSNYCKDVLTVAGLNQLVTYVHIDHPSELTNYIVKETCHGGEGQCCPSGE